MGDFIAVVVAALIGSSSGAALIQWQIEKRRETRAHQRSLIAEWRAGVAEYEAAITSTRLSGPPPFISALWYRSLQGHLTKEARRDVEQRKILQVGGGDYCARRLRGEIDRLEGEWRLRPGSKP